MAWMLTPLSARAPNMVLATPAWLRMPTPITETLETLSSTRTSSKPISAWAPLTISTALAASRLPTVKSILATLSSRERDWTIMSTFTLPSARREKIAEDTPGWSGRPNRVILASSRL
jgi:hypothetical protein